ncbi:MULTISPECIES: acylphosphatase [Bacillus]|uniref:Acylphosphatase n=2 Tax=Bacillus TaxID=1386 RepID=A0A0M4FUQ1_9BACI|nr:MULTISPECIES: acylphosphatase [Bacillus]ALC84023.1 acylphosphatase [Bacillus gobiensis]MBP1082878.1 acylphosphatase [Bacillus capparidis]MED1098135.1 acylphosphatase [Bacillus capparidis]
MLQYHIVVEGRVQGVGFRYFVQSEAEKNKLTGWVKNRMDGAVEILAEGPEESLADFVESVQKGNRFSRVRNVTVEEAAATESYKNFAIAY